MNLEAFWDSPGPSRFIDTALDNIDKFGVVAVHAPDRIANLVPDILAKKAFSRNRVQPVSIHMKDIGVARSPVSLLASRLQGGRRIRIRTTKDFLDTLADSPRTVIVSGLNRETWDLWSGFVSSVRSETKNDVSKIPKIVVVMPANVSQKQMLQTFGNQALQRWQGIVDRLDMESWVNQEHLPASGIVERLARETCLEVSGPNMFLLRELLKLDERQQIEPWGILKEASETWVGKKSATWREGLVDEWDGAVRVDTMVLAIRNQRAAFGKRVWRAQARILLSFIEDIRSMIVRRHSQYLQGLLPWDHPHFNNRNTRHHIDEYDIRDLSLALRNRMTKEERDLVLSAAKDITNPLAHMSTVSYDDVIQLLHLYDEVSIPVVEPGWDWPDVGQKLVMLVGSPAAGKSTWAKRHYDRSEIVSSDEVRASSPRFRGRGKDKIVFDEVRTRAMKLLKDGSNAVIDATHLKAEDRKESRSIVPRWMKIEYVVVDRPLEEKVRDQDWRIKVGEDFVREMHERFIESKEEILRGDDDPRVTVNEISS